MLIIYIYIYIDYKINLNRESEIFYSRFKLIL